MRFKLPQKNQTAWALLLLSILSMLLQGLVFHSTLISKLLIPWLMYFSFLLILRPYASAIFVFLLECLLVRIHLMKLALTNTPFEVEDIFAWKQALFLKSYSDWLIPILALALIVCVVKGFSLRKKQWVFLPIFILLSVSCMQESHPTETKTNPVSYLFRLARVTYVDWNLVTNVKENGIFNHIFLTLSMGGVPAKGSLPYKEVSQPAHLALDKEAPDVFLVLCESCYTSSDGNFVTPISKLEDQGYSHATVISPVYGGMTAEAEFEVLTGLPSRRHKGIDFQYYAEKYAKDAMAAPRVFAKHGYSTFSAHANVGFFWKREIVHPKFGFQKSYFVDDIKGAERGKYAEDRILFDSVLDKYQENLKEGKKTFAFLITVYTHGPYSELNGDGGEQAYKDKVKKTTQQFVDFQKAAARLAAAHNRPVVFVIFGDHKPAMTVSFYRRHEFNDDYFTLTGSKNESFRFADLDKAQQIVFGKVPMYVKGYGMKDSATIGKFVKGMEERPLFCLPALMAEDVGVQDAFFRYSIDVCRKNPEVLVDLDALGVYYPDTVYAGRLFE
ncbi:LTA synthase family protein [Bdellovibrio sp. HCB-162]|uniref:LTA synthase family protein n=1 Tax=Bdellovibrio sp. HCB-162 TaxID=3394234 RepID=UPI0039BCA986